MVHFFQGLAVALASIAPIGVQNLFVINSAMSFLRASFPTARFVLLTPIHRGFATFGAQNVQPDESFANGAGLFIDDYVAAVKEAGGVWAATVICFGLRLAGAVMPVIWSGTIWACLTWGQRTGITGCLIS